MATRPGRGRSTARPAWSCPPIGQVAAPGTRDGRRCAASASRRSPVSRARWSPPTTAPTSSTPRALDLRAVERHGPAPRPRRGHRHAPSRSRRSSTARRLARGRGGRPASPRPRAGRRVADDARAWRASTPSTACSSTVRSPGSRPSATAWPTAWWPSRPPTPPRTPPGRTARRSPPRSPRRSPVAAPARSPATPSRCWPASASPPSTRSTSTCAERWCSTTCSATPARSRPTLGAELLQDRRLPRPAPALSSAVRRSDAARCRRDATLRQCHRPYGRSWRRRTSRRGRSKTREVEDAMERTTVVKEMYQGYLDAHDLLVAGTKPSDIPALAASRHDWTRPRSSPSSRSDSSSAAATIEQFMVEPQTSDYGRRRNGCSSTGTWWSRSTEAR